MEEIFENILKGYKEGLRKAKETSNIICPFCEEDNFDLIGLKIHLLNHCSIYDKTENQ